MYFLGIKLNKNELLSIDSFLFLSLCAFCFLLPINEAASTKTIFVAVGLSILSWKNYNGFILKQGVLLLVLYLVYICGYFRDGNGFGVHLFETKASLFVFPYIFSFVKLTYEQYVSIFKAFVLGCLCSYIICLLYPFVYDFDWSEFEFKIVKPIDFLVFPSQNYNWLNNFVSLYFTHTLNRSYFAFFIVFSIVFVFLHRKCYNKGELRVVLFMLLIALFQITAISGLLSLLFCLIAFILSISHMRKKLTYLSYLFVIIISILSFFPRVAEYASEVSLVIKNQQPLDDEALNERGAFWKSSVAVFKQNPFFGNGIKTTQQMLNIENSKRLKWEMAWVEEQNFNAHNQYLQFLGESGILGLMVFFLSIAWFLAQLKSAVITLEYFFLAILFIHFLSESILYRYWGISFFAFFYCLLIKFNESKYNLKISK